MVEIRNKFVVDTLNAIRAVANNLNVESAGNCSSKFCLFGGLVMQIFFKTLAMFALTALGSMLMHKIKVAPNSSRLLKYGASLGLAFLAVRK